MQRFIALTACLCFVVSGTSVAWAQADNTILGFDITAPTISHTPTDEPGIAGDVQTIAAQISDNQSVASALLFYRNSSAETYSTAEMSADATNTTWLATIDTTTEDTRVNYYIVAEDTDGNRVQKGGAGNPLTLKLQQPQVLSTVVPVESDGNRNAWLGVGLGVAAAALLLLATSGGGGGGGDSDDGIINSDDDTECCTITFTAPNVTTEP